MLRSRAALAVGLLVVLLAFAYGTEVTASTTVAGRQVSCGAAIDASWLLSGSTGPAFDAVAPTTAAVRREAAACDTVVERTRIGVLSTMAAGALLALVGWTSLGDPSSAGQVSGGRPRRPGPQQRRPRGRRPAHGGRTATG